MLAYVIGIILAPIRMLRRRFEMSATAPIIQITITDKDEITPEVILAQVEDLQLHHPDAAGIEVILQGASFGRVKRLIPDITKKNVELAPSVQFDTGLAYGRDGHLLFSRVRHAE